MRTRTSPNRSAALLLLILTGLPGCAVGPDYRPPSVDAPNAFRFEVKEAKNLADTAWWEQFQDPVINELIGIALAENKDVKIAAARVEQFLGRLASTRSPLFPQVSASAIGQRQRSSEFTQVPPPAGVSSIGELYEALLSVSWEIDVFGRLRRQTEAARADVLASEEGRRATILSLVSSVALSYINLRNLDQQLQILQATAASRGESFRVFQLRFNAGTVSELELTQNRAEYEDSLARIPPLESQIAQQEDALSILLGRNPGQIRRGRELAKLALPAVPAGLPSELLARRPDLRQAEQNLISANALIGAARAQYFPTISLTGLLGSVSGELSDLFSGAAKTWTFGAAAAVPIFTAGGIAGQVQQAEAVQQQTLQQYQKAIQVAFQEVTDALITLQKSREQLQAQDRQVNTLTTYARLARVRYENGYTSLIDVLDAERNLFNAQVSYTQTQNAVYASLVNLYKAMGGGWVAEAERMVPNDAEQGGPQ
ncbi:MAG: outer membrane protein multidrug efflux system [Burkholderiales bacterium]